MNGPPNSLAMLIQARAVSRLATASRANDELRIAHVDLPKKTKFFLLGAKFATELEEIELSKSKRHEDRSGGVRNAPDARSKHEAQDSSVSHAIKGIQ